MVADRTTLKPPEPKPERLDRGTGDPDRGEKMSRSASDHDMASQPATAEPGGKRLKKDARDHKHRQPPANKLARPCGLRLAALTGSHTAVLYHAVITAP
jgi:hypothetical protein